MGPVEVKRLGEVLDLVHLYIDTTEIIQRAFECLHVAGYKGSRVLADRAPHEKSAGTYTTQPPAELPKERFPEIFAQIFQLLGDDAIVFFCCGMAMTKMAG